MLNPYQGLAFINKKEQTGDSDNSDTRQEHQGSQDEWVPKGHKLLSYISVYNFLELK